MSIYLFPVKGLLTSIDLDLAIGRVRLLGPDRAKVQLHHAADPSSLPQLLRGDFDEFETELGSCVAARVEAEDKDVAVDLVEAALDVLRVFLYTRARAKMPTFGMTDGGLGGAVQYADLGSGGLGWFRIGHFTGVHITEESAQAYVGSNFAAIAGAAVGAPAPTHNQAKALTAIRLASRALLTHDPATQTVLMMTAAEVLLFGPGEKSKTYRLAQRCAFLLCGRPDGGLCGRDRDSCLILTADLSSGGAGMKQLKKIEEMSSVDRRWCCSEWLNVLDWYDIRSEVVHEGGTVGHRDASRVSFWLVNRLLPATLDWYTENPENPHAAIESALRGLPQPPSWQLEYETAYQELADDGAFGEAP